MPVVHSPLVTSILAAIANKQALVLPPGKHATDKHSRATIAVPATGLQILSDPTLPRPIIQRPNNGLDGDDQCGLHFVPDHPTQPEIDAAQWKQGVIGQRLKDFKNGPEFIPPVDVFEYDILVRGDITIQDVDIDCNMQNQPLNQQAPVVLGSMRQCFGSTGYATIPSQAFRALISAHPRTVCSGGCSWRSVP